MDIDYWTEEYERCKADPSYFIARYSCIKGGMLYMDLPDGLKIGGANSEGKFVPPQSENAELQHVIDQQRMINRLMYEIEFRKHK